MLEYRHLLESGVENTAQDTNQDHHDKYNNHAHNCTNNGRFSTTTPVVWLLLDWEQLIGKILSCAIVKSVEIFLHQCCRG